MNDFANPEFDRYRLVLITRGAGRLFVELTQEGADLPRISVPRWTRATHQIQSVAYDRWGLRILVMEFLGDEPGGDGMVVAEVLDGGELARHRGCVWLSLDEMPEGSITGDERDLLRKLISAEPTNRGPFSRLGWSEQLYEWIESIPEVTEGFRFTDELEQFSASSTSMLIRLTRADRRHFWFKAAGSPNAHESEFTRLLTGLAPGYLPTLIASHDRWNGWLMEDAGNSLDMLRSVSPRTLEQIVRRLAEFQRETVDHIHTMLAAGCRDHRTPALLAGVDELLPYLHEAMAQQQLDCIPKIEMSRLRVVREVLEQACIGLEWIGVPNSLNHGDIHPGNILVRGRRSVFTDWARASVGNPFITFFQLREHLAHERLTNSWMRRLTKVYQEVWKSVVPVFLTDRALNLIPMVSSASSLVDRRELLISTHGQRPEFQRYVRSLVRQMDKAARALEPTLTVCA